MHPHRHAMPPAGGPLGMGGGVPMMPGGHPGGHVTGGGGGGGGGGPGAGVGVAPTSLLWKVLLSADQAAALLGRGAGMLNALQERHGVVMVPPSAPDDCFPGTPFRVVVVRGALFNVRATLSDFVHLLYDDSRARWEASGDPMASHPPPTHHGGYGGGGGYLAPPGPHHPHHGGGGPDFVARAVLPDHSAGAIIGKGGSTVRSIAMETGAHIKLATPDARHPGLQERPVTVTGSRDGVHLAMMRIFDLMSAEARNLVFSNPTPSYQGRHGHGHGMGGTGGGYSMEGGVPSGLVMMNSGGMYGGGDMGMFAPPPSGHHPGGMQLHHPMPTTMVRGGSGLGTHAPPMGLHMAMHMMPSYAAFAPSGLPGGAESRDMMLGGHASLPWAPPEAPTMPAVTGGGGDGDRVASGQTFFIVVAPGAPLPTPDQLRLPPGTKYQYVIMDPAAGAASSATSAAFDHGTAGGSGVGGDPIGIASPPSPRGGGWGPAPSPQSPTSRLSAPSPIMAEGGGGGGGGMGVRRSLIPSRSNSGRSLLGNSITMGALGHGSPLAGMGDRRGSSPNSTLASHHQDRMPPSPTSPLEHTPQGHTLSPAALGGPRSGSDGYAGSPTTLGGSGGPHGPIAPSGGSGLGFRSPYVTNGGSGVGAYHTSGTRSLLSASTHSSSRSIGSVSMMPISSAQDAAISEAVAVEESETHNGAGGMVVTSGRDGGGASAGGKLGLSDAATASSAHSHSLPLLARSSQSSRSLGGRLETVSEMVELTTTAGLAASASGDAPVTTVSVSLKKAAVAPPLLRGASDSALVRVHDAIGTSLLPITPTPPNRNSLLHAMAPFAMPSTTAAASATATLSTGEGGGSNGDGLAAGSLLSGSAVAGLSRMFSRLNRS